MDILNFRPTFCFLIACVTLPLLSACQTTPQGPTSTISVPRSGAGGPVGIGQSKQYTTVADWRHGDWVIKRGATVTFRDDGFGSFSARVYTEQPARKQELRFQSVQYGRDGNILFLAPAADLGYAIHARHPTRDYPVDLNFGFDARHFQYIDQVSYVSRISGTQETTTATRRARSSGKSF